MPTPPLASSRFHSLRWRLLRAVFVAALIVWGLTGFFSYSQAQHEAEELMDGNLAQTARLLLALVRNNEDHLGDLAARLATVRGGEENIYEPPLEFQIGLGDGTILLRSTNAPSLPVLGVTGYSDIVREKASWRVLNMVAKDGNYRIQVAQSIALRDQAALEVASRTVFPVGIVLPLLLLLIYYSIRSALKPLDELASDVATRTPETLSALPNRNVPAEVLPLVAALNRLFYRLGTTLENERRFTADAAHELRTPLAALKIHTQVAQLADNPQTREHALHQLEAGVDRASHLVDQLLRLARLDPLAKLPAPFAFDLGDAAREAIASVLDSLTECNHDLQVDIPETPTLIQGDRDLIKIAVRNLVENALRYTPAGGKVEIMVTKTHGNLSLRVSDNGPGVLESELPKLAERFYRGRDNTTEGNGLGLAIVCRIAELHNARFHVENAAAGGFIAELTWLNEQAG